MQFGLSLFATFIVPLIMMIVWLTCLWRLRSRVLLTITIILTTFILFSTSNPLIITVRNPYLMLVLSAILVFNVAILSRSGESDRAYLITANSVLLLMIAALHAWNLYLRQSDLFFYEQSSTGTLTYTAALSLLSLLLPVIAFFKRPTQ